MTERDRPSVLIYRRTVVALLGVGPAATLLACQSNGAKPSSSTPTSASAPHPTATAAPAASPPLEMGSYATPAERGRPAYGAPGYGTATPGGGCNVTGGDVKGPFHRPDAPTRTKLAADGEPGGRIHIQGRVLGPDCKTPIANAALDVWHADATGNYDMASRNFKLRGRLTSDASGGYAFDTILPGRYKLGASFRPAHIHFMVSAAGFAPIVTQLYFSGDPYLQPNDPCGVCASGDKTLIIDLSAGAAGVKQGKFGIVLASA